jgi:transcriptional regulator with PAS, ATPase and Fis domain
VNCAALNDQLLESRLFGYRKGTFTGANEDRKGIFEDTEGGTVFLDEIGDSSPAVQMALLRVLQDHQVTRVGETKGKPVDVRVIAATHRDIAQRCQEGHFRWDLYYRLAVAELELPPLRQWESSEIEALLDYFLLKRQKDFRRPQPLKLTAEARKTLLVYTYPGNFREIEHLIERLYVFFDTEVDYYDLPIRIRNPNPDSSLLLKDVERKHIERVYRYFNGNKSRTAQALGCALNTLKKKINQYEIESI